MPCCDADFECEVDRSGVRAYNDRTVVVPVEWGYECRQCGSRELNGCTHLGEKFKHSCRKLKKLREDELHFSIQEVGELEYTERYSDEHDFKITVKVSCNACYKDIEVTLDSEI